jgi:hypothetical protein
VEPLFQVLRETIAVEDMVPARKQKCANILLSALVASRSIRDSEKTLSELEMKTLIETARNYPETRNAVWEVLKKFRPGEC